MANRNPKVVAKYIDAYGNVRKIHKNRGRRLAVARLRSTPLLALNRAAAELFGPKVRAMRKLRGMTAKEVGERAGFVDSQPKQRVYAIECQYRNEGVRMGTVYALAIAMNCSVSDLMPSKEEVFRKAGVRFDAEPTLQMPADDEYNLTEVDTDDEDDG